MKSGHNTSSTLPDLYQRSRSVLQEWPKSLRLFWKEEKLKQKKESYNRRYTVSAACHNKEQIFEIVLEGRKKKLHTTVEVRWALRVKTSYNRRNTVSAVCHDKQQFQFSATCPQGIYLISGRRKKRSSRYIRTTSTPSERGYSVMISLILTFRMRERNVFRQNLLSKATLTKLHNT